MLKAVVLIVLACGFPAFSQEFPQETQRVTSPFALELFEAREDNTLGVAPTAPDLRKVSDLGIALIIHFEGAVKQGKIHVPYDDSAGFCTIGYGRLLGKSKCRTMDLGMMRNGISEDEAVRLLQEDLAFARQAVHESAVYDPTPGSKEKPRRIEINIDQFSALVSFVFNVGKGNFKNSTLLRRIRQDRNDLAAREFLRWIRAGGQVFPGLIARRECEQTLFRGALAFGADGHFTRAACSSLGIAGTVGDLVDINVGEIAQ